MSEIQATIQPTTDVRAVVSEVIAGIRGDLGRQPLKLDLTITARLRPILECRADELEEALHRLITAAVGSAQGTVSVFVDEPAGQDHIVVEIRIGVGASARLGPRDLALPTGTSLVRTVDSDGWCLIVRPDDLCAGTDACATQPAQASPPAPLRVLVAEDNPVNRRVAQGFLKRAGCEIVTVENGAEAVAAALGGDFDLVLMDIDMPVLDGLSATRALRAQEHRRTLIVALTANHIHGSPDACMDAGMDDHMLKPLRADRLEEILDACRRR